MTRAQDNFKKLHDISKTTVALDSIHRLLEWDQETYMPRAGAPYRGLQMEALASYVHKQKTGPRFSKALGKLIDIDSGQLIDTTLTPTQNAALREWRRDFLKDKKLPNAFVKNFAKLTSNSLMAWAEAKHQGKFKGFAPYLEKIVAQCRKQADLLGYKEHPYDALLDNYEPEMTVKELTPLFENLKLSLITLLKKIMSCQDIPHDFLEGSFARDKQLHFGKVLMKAMGFDEETCRLDISNHPFCSPMNPKDLRMTTRIHPTHLMDNIFAVIHEGGHGLYHMGFTEDLYGTPLFNSVSHGIDESQSLFWEKRIGRSESFWRYFYPLLQKEFPEKLGDIYFDDFYRGMNRIHPSMIRTEADEVTYCLHVILRFEIERGLMEGSVKVKEIPEIWNEKMRTYLGVVPKADNEGCLQDVHWAMGYIGYFPTYALGNLYSVQFFETFNQKSPEWKKQAEIGNLAPIREWLRTNIHQHGREFSAEELCRKVTGEALSAEPFARYLDNKYKSIYHF